MRLFLIKLPIQENKSVIVQVVEDKVNCFSVIIPAYNSKNTIIDTLKSAVFQTTRPTEIIVVDDGSTDNTGKLIKYYAESIRNQYENIHYYRLETNAGPSVARNYGVHVSKSEWILFLDADDQWEKTRIEMLIQFIIGNKNAKFIFSKYKYQNGKITPNKITSFIIKLNGNRVHRWLLFIKSFIATPTVAIKKEIFEGGFLAGLTHCEDLDLWLRISEKHKLYFQNEILAYSSIYSNDERSLSSDYKKMKKMTYKVLNANAVSVTEKIIAKSKQCYIILVSNYKKFSSCS